MVNGQRNGVLGCAARVVAQPEQPPQIIETSEDRLKARIFDFSIELLIIVAAFWNIGWSVIIFLEW
jgi:hypothetical protein